MMKKLRKLSIYKWIWTWNWTWIWTISWMRCL